MWKLKVTLVTAMEKNLFLRGRRETITLNNHRVRVILPDEKISFEEAKKRVEKLRKKIKKKR